MSAEPPFTWVAPQLLRPGAPAPPRARLLAWSAEYVAVPRVVIRQDGRVLARRALPWPLSPGRAFRIPWRLLDRVDPRGGPVTISLA